MPVGRTNSGIRSRDEMSKAISSHTGGDLTEAQVARVLASIDAVEEGDALGTVIRKDNGDIYVRVEIRGVARWAVTGAEGSSHYDMQSTVAGTVLYAPEPAKVVPKPRKSSGKK